MRRRSLTLLLVAVVLAACGSDSAGSGAPATPAGTTNPTASAATPPMTTASAAVIVTTTLGSAPVPSGEHALTVVDAMTGTTRWAVESNRLLEIVGAVLPTDETIVGFGSDCGGEQYAAAWDRDTGAEQWSMPLGSVRRPDGTYREMESIAFGSIDGLTAFTQDDTVVGVDIASGEIIWTYRPDARLTGLAPTASTLVVSTRDSSGAVTVVGLDPSTGDPRWNAEPSGAESRGAFVAGEELIVLVGDRSGEPVMVALSDDGSTLWEVTGSPGSDRFVPAIGDGDVLVASDPSGSRLIGFDPRDGRERWNVDGITLPQHEYSDLVPSGVIIVNTGDGLASLDPEDGATLWSTTWDEQGAHADGYEGVSADGGALIARSLTPEGSLGDARTAIAIVGDDGERWSVPIDPDWSERVAGYQADDDTLFVLTGCVGG